MSEQTQVPPDQSQQAGQPAQPEMPGSGGGAGLDSGEIEEGKVFAILSYALSFIGLPFFLIPLIMRNNGFSLYHAKQVMLLWLAGVACGMVCSIPFLGCIVAALIPVVAIFLTVLNVMGLVNACKAEQKPVPLIGKWAEEWFKGITKV